MAEYIQTPEGQAASTVTLGSFTLAAVAGDFSIGAGAASASEAVVSGVAVLGLALVPPPLVTIPTPVVFVVDLTTEYLTGGNCPTLVPYPPTGQRWPIFRPIAS